MNGYNLESRVKSLEMLTSLLLAITNNIQPGSPAPLETLRNLLSAHPDILTEDLLSYLEELENTAALLKEQLQH